MKIARSSKCSLKFATEAKRAQLREVLAEYGRVTNFFIAYFWSMPEDKVPSKAKLLKPIVDLPLLMPEKTWLSARLRKVAAREALDMIQAVRRRWRAKPSKATMPIHRGGRMVVSSTIAKLEEPKETGEFDAWLMLRSIGQKVSLDLPIRYHKHFNELQERSGSRRLNAYVITEHNVQFSFEIETGAKRTKGPVHGLDSGINALASLDDGRQFGLDIKPIIEAIKRCKWGSRRQKRLRRSLKQRMDEVAKAIVSTTRGLRLLVVEKLRKLNHKTKVKRRLTKTMRRSLGAWVYRYWLERLQRASEDNRVVFRSVPPQYTSQRCHACGHIERGNRSGEKFKCRLCGHVDNADVNAAKNILDRFLSGPYGAGFQPVRL